MKKNKWLALKGEGTNCHFIEGDFEVLEEQRFSSLHVDSKGVLHHLTPSGVFTEHNPLPLEKGLFIQGRQVETNPFDGTITDVWD